MRKKHPRIMVKRNKYLKKSEGQYQVWIVSGVQSFRFDYQGTKAECHWYRRMLRKAGLNA